MQYEYVKDLHAAIKPGTRHWVCGLRLNPSLTRYVRNQPPIYIEACVGKDPKLETDYRRRGVGVNAVVPVLPDGSRDWKHASGVSDLHWYDVQAVCESKYLGLISEYERKMDAMIDGINARRAAMRKCRDEIMSAEPEY